MYKYSFWLILGLAVVLASATAQAYTIGNPAGAAGTGKLHVSAEYEFQNRELPGSLPTESHRYLVKGSYGVTSWLDIFARGGVAGLEIPFQDSRFVGEDSFAWGIGGRATVVRFPRWRSEIFSTGQVFTYRTRGRVDQQVVNSPETWTRQLNSKYIWWEYGGALGVKTRQGAVSPYFGVDLSYIEGEKITDQYNVFSYGSVYGGKSNTNFSSEDLLLNPFVGLDVNLPLRYKLSAEVRGTSRDEISFSIGLSQRSP